MTGFRNGNETSFTAIFKSLYPALRLFSSQIISDQGAAEEIAEEAFIKVWERREMFHRFNTLKAYLYSIVRNDSINWLKLENRRQASQAAASPGVHTAERLAWEILVQTELTRELYTAISLLPPQRQKVFRKLYEEGKSVKEVAGELNLSISAIKDHKRSGLIFLRKILPVIAILIFFKCWL